MPVPTPTDERNRPLLVALVLPVVLVVDLLRLALTSVRRAAAACLRTTDAAMDAFADAVGAAIEVLVRPISYVARAVPRMLLVLLRPLGPLGVRLVRGMVVAHKAVAEVIPWVLGVLAFLATPLQTAGGVLWLFVRGRLPVVLRPVAALARWARRTVSVALGAVAHVIAALVGPVLRVFRRALTMVTLLLLRPVRALARAARGAGRRTRDRLAQAVRAPWRRTREYVRTRVRDVRAQLRRGPGR